MNWRSIFAIARKDLLEVQQNKAAWVPMIVVPLVFILIMPLAFILIPPSLPAGIESFASDSDLNLFLDNLPPSFGASLAGLDAFQIMVKVILGYLFAPFFLIFPLMFSTIIAAESFAGERERKTMEALLYTPASDGELFLGKVLAGMIPSLLITWGSFLGYILVLNAAGWSLFGGVWFPLPGWYPLIFWIAPALALLGVSATVLISSRTQTFMGAYQTSGSLVVIVLGLVVGQATGVLYLSVGVGLLVGVIFWLVAALLTWLAIRTFNRTQLLTSVERIKK